MWCHRPINRHSEHRQQSQQLNYQSTQVNKYKKSEKQQVHSVQAHWTKHYNSVQERDQLKGEYTGEHSIR